MSESTPRINAKYLESFMHQTVRIVGKVTALHGDKASLDADGQVTVQLNREAHIKLNNAAEIVGKVQADLEVKAFQASDWGEDFNYDAANKLVDISQKYKQIFHGEEE